MTIAGELGARRRIEVDVVDLAGARTAVASVEVLVTLLRMEHRRSPRRRIHR